MCFLEIGGVTETRIASDLEMATQLRAVEPTVRASFVIDSACSSIGIILQAEKI
jgi:hypothetical protein